MKREQCMKRRDFIASIVGSMGFLSIADFSHVFLPDDPGKEQIVCAELIHSAILGSTLVAYVATDGQAIQPIQPGWESYKQEEIVDGNIPVNWQGIWSMEATSAFNNGRFEYKNPEGTRSFVIVAEVSLEDTPTMVQKVQYVPLWAKVRCR